MPEKRLSKLQNPFLLWKTFHETKDLYGKRAAWIQQCWIWLSYAMIIYTIGIVLYACFIYFLLDVLSSTSTSTSTSTSSGGANNDTDDDYYHVYDVYGNDAQLHRLSDNYYMDSSGETYQRYGKSFRRLSDGEPFNN